MQIFIQIIDFKEMGEKKIVGFKKTFLGLKVFFFFKIFFNCYSKIVIQKSCQIIIERRK